MKVEKNDVNHLIEKALLTGATTGILSAQVFPSANYVLPPSLSGGAIVEIPLVAVATGIGALNSVVCDALHLSVNKGIPLPKKAKDMTTFASSVGASALSMYLLLRLGGVEIGLVNSAIAGAVGEVAGGLAFYYLKENKYL